MSQQVRTVGPILSGSEIPVFKRNREPDSCVTLRKSLRTSHGFWGISDSTHEVLFAGTCYCCRVMAKFQPRAWILSQNEPHAGVKSERSKSIQVKMLRGSESYLLFQLPWRGIFRRSLWTTFVDPVQSTPPRQKKTLVSWIRLCVGLIGLDCKYSSARVG